MSLTTAPHPAPGSPAAAPSRTAPILALARVEAGRLLRHPAFLLGLAASVLLSTRLGEEDWAGQSYYETQAAWTFVWMGTLVAAALVAGRDRFLSDPDLLPGMPATPGDRVLATALALLVPTLVSGLAVAGIAIANALAGGFTHGDEPYAREIVPSLAEWAQPVLLVALAGVVGIGVAQLRRARLAVLGVLLFATFAGGTAVWAFQVQPLRVLHPFMYPAYEEKLPASFSPEGWPPDGPPLNAPGEYNSTWLAVRFDTAALAWHLVYVSGLILLGLWWGRRAADRGEPATARWLALVGLSLLILGGVAQVLLTGGAGGA